MRHVYDLFKLIKKSLTITHLDVPGGHTLSNNAAVCRGPMSSFAADQPPAATAGTPGPGKLLSPTTRNPASGVDALVMGIVS